MASHHRRTRADRLLVTLGLALALGQAAPTTAQQRLLLPEGTVLTVRTETALNSMTVEVGQTFNTVLADSVRLDGYTVIPKNSRIEGNVTVARKATTQESGLIGVEFDRLVFPNGRAVAIDGRLTSTDPAERRQIEAQGDTRVVFVGGRRGVGAAIGSIGAGAGNDPVAGVLGALGGLLSSGADVTVPVGTQLAVQLARGITLSATDRPAAGAPRADAFTIYTSADMIRAAQQALKAQDYYRGQVDGRLTEETQRALFEFQIDNRILATGNLDGRTAMALNLSATSPTLALSVEEAALMRRNAQVLTGRWREYIRISTTGRLDPRRSYQPVELELHFALSAFADNASLYDQIVRVSGNTDGVAAANAALVSAARRVEAALGSASAPARISNAWAAIQADLTPLDRTY